MAGRHHGEPRKRIGIFAGSERVEGALEPRAGLRKLRGEFLHNVRADFVAALADARADCGENVGGLRGKFHLHAAESFCGDARERAAPSGVDGGDGVMARVDEQDGNAVGGLNGEEEAGRARGEGVAFGRLGRRRGDEVRDVGMDLAQGDEREFRVAEGFGEAAAVFVDALAAVPVSVAEVENFFAARLAGTARFENADAS